MKTIEPTPRPTHGVTGPESPDSALDRLWERGERPCVGAFLSAQGADALPLEDLLAVLRVDQRRRWLSGERVDVRTYRRDFPAVAADPEAFFELVYHEILIREDLGERPDPGEYARSFPDLAERLRLQVEVHEELSLHDGDPVKGDWAPPDGAPGNDATVPAIPGYELLGEIGRGGMGIVYRARQIRPSRLVALKMILEGRFATEHDVLRFENEVEAIAALDHPSVVPILEVGQHGRLPYFTMPLLTGGSLAEAQERLAAAPRALAEAMIEVARAVHHGHERGILHRDLKPANILFDEAGRPHITDFGLAKRVQGRTGLTQPGALLGSPGYMAPEQASGDAAAITTATDVYGLGAILYATLTGRAPFEGRSFHETLARVQVEAPEPPSRVNRSVPSPLELICLKCLEKEPGRRYSSAAAVADDLARWLAGEPIVARPVPTTVRAWLWIRRHPTHAALVAALVLALVGGAGAATLLWLRAEASLGAEREARQMLAVANNGLNRINRELESARTLEKEARIRAQERFNLALRAVRDTIDGPGANSILRLTDAHGSRQGVILRIIELYKTLQASLEGDPTPGARAQLASSFARLGSLTAEVGSADVALAAVDRAIEIRHELSAREPENSRRVLEEATEIVGRGGLERRFGMQEAALRSYQRARTLLDALDHRTPEDNHVQTELAWCLGNLGAVQLTSGHAEDALRTHRRVLEIREGLVARNPGSSFYRSDRSWGRLDLAYCFRALDRASDAVAALELARAEFEAIHEERPSDADVGQRLVDCLNALAETRAAQQQFDPMLTASSQACALIEEVAKAHPEVPRFKLSWAWNLRNLSARQRLAKLPARPAMARSAAIFDELVTAYPGVHQYRIDLIRVLLQLGSLARADRDSAAAGEAARQAVDRSVPLAQDPTTDESLLLAALSHLNLAITNLDGNHPDQARGLIRSAESLMRRAKTVTPYAVYDLACALSLLSTQADSMAERATINDRAMSTLISAVRGGFRNYTHIRDDPDMDPLRHRPEYQLLLLDLAFPDKPFGG
jgi:serine/threonine-protein kinase